MTLLDTHYDELMAAGRNLQQRLRIACDEIYPDGTGKHRAHLHWIYYANDVRAGSKENDGLSIEFWQDGAGGGDLDEQLYAIPLTAELLTNESRQVWVAAWQQAESARAQELAAANANLNAARILQLEAELARLRQAQAQPGH